MKSHVLVQHFLSGVTLTLSAPSLMNSHTQHFTASWLPSRMSCALTADTAQPSALAAWMQRLLFWSASLGASSLAASAGRFSALSSIVSGTQEFSSLLQSTPRQQSACTASDYEICGRHCSIKAASSTSV